MKKMVKKQSGLTFAGLCIILAIIATYVLFVLTAFPLYNEYMSVQTVMKGVAAMPKDKVKKDKAILKAFVKRAGINNLNRFGETKIKNNKELVVIETNKKTKKKTLIVTYRAKNNLFSNLNLMLDVKESIPLGVGATSTTSLIGGGDAK